MLHGHTGHLTLQNIKKKGGNLPGNKHDRTCLFVFVTKGSAKIILHRLPITFWHLDKKKKKNADSFLSNTHWSNYYARGPGTHWHEKDNYTIRKKVCFFCQTKVFFSRMIRIFGEKTKRKICFFSFFEKWISYLFFFLNSHLSMGTGFLSWRRPLTFASLYSK